MGIRPTGLPWIVLLAGLSGALVALVGQWWTNAVDYPFWISGKPLFSLPANIPVIFELTILLSAFGAFLGMLALNKLPQLSNPLFRKASFLRATTDRFFLMIEAADSQFDATRTRALLDSLDCEGVEVCETETGRSPLPKLIFPVLLIAACVALIPPALIARARVTTSDKPRWHTFRDMDFQPKFKAQTAAPSALFADGRADRLPVPGTVARGSLNVDADYDRLYRGIDPEAEAAAGESARTTAAGTSAEAAEPKPEEDAGAEAEKPAGEAPAEEPPQSGAANGQAADEEPQPAWVTTFPVKVSSELMARGRQRFNIYCAPCHGLVGDGDGVVSKRSLALEQGTWVPPLSLHAESVVSQPVGQIFNTITHGVRKMPSYGDQIAVEDRWAIVLYVRALQRSRNASPDDVPADVRESMRDL